MTPTLTQWPTERGEWAVSNDAYHADVSKVGKSMLDDFRRSRRLYQARYVTRTLPQPEPSNGMVRGSLLHMRILEPDRFMWSVIPQAAFNRRTKDGKEQAAAFEKKVRENGQIVAEPELIDCIAGMASAIEQNDKAQFLLGLDGPTEHSIWWRDPETGLACKARRDKIADGLIFDVKTCESAAPHAFAKAASYYGYHRQAAHYLDGDRMWRGGEAAFVFIVVSHEPPYQCACYELDEAAIERGRQENRDALSALASCIDSGDWSDPFERQITRLSLADWAMRDDWRMA